MITDKKLRLKYKLWQLLNKHVYKRLVKIDYIRLGSVNILHDIPGYNRTEKI